MIENFTSFLDLITPDHVKRETSRQLRLTFNQLIPSVLKKYEELTSQQATPVEQGSAAGGGGGPEEKLNDGLAAQPVRQSSSPQPIAAPRRPTGGLDMYRYSDTEEEGTGEEEGSCSEEKTPDAKEPEDVETQALAELVRELPDPTHVGALGQAPDKPDLTVKLLVFGRVWTLTSALSFWSLLQGKTEKITRARYGLDLLKASLMDFGRDQGLDKVELLRDVTDVLFSHRIRQVQAGTQQSVTRSGQKFAGLLLEPQNAYMRYVIFVSMCRCFRGLPSEALTQYRVNNESFALGSEAVGGLEQQARTLFDKQKEQQPYNVHDSRAMTRLLMVWAELKYRKANSRGPGEEAVPGVSSRFFASDRAPRLLLVRDETKDQLIRSMRQQERALRRAR